MTPTRGRLLGLVVEGFEVHYDPDAYGTAWAVGVFSSRRIMVGPSWLILPPREKQALLLHEAAHLRGHHMLARVLFATLLFPLVWTPVGHWFGARQELAADAFVVKKGYGADLLRFLRRCPRASGGDYYPGFGRRAAAIEREIRHAATA